jgi:hypothetical protein
MACKKDLEAFGSTGSDWISIVFECVHLAAQGVVATHPGASPRHGRRRMVAPTTCYQLSTKHAAEQYVGSYLSANSPFREHTCLSAR